MPRPALTQIKLRHERLVAMSKTPAVEGEQAGTGAPHQDHTPDPSFHI